jgi:hypothetical protein
MKLIDEPMPLPHHQLVRSEESAFLLVFTRRARSGAFFLACLRAPIPLDRCIFSQSRFLGMINP